MPRDPALLERALDRLRVILERDAEESDAWVERARAISRVRQLNERDVLPKRKRAPVRDDRRHRFAWASLGGERQRHVDLRVLGECLRVRTIDARAVAR